MGVVHPITETTHQLICYFVKRGYQLKLFSEVRTVEDEFDSVYIRKENPVRDYSRTFYLDDNHVLQGHMTAIRESMKKNGIGKFISPGRIYRVNREDTSHTIISHQFEGCVIGIPYSMKDFHSLMCDCLFSLGIKSPSIIMSNDFTVFSSPTIQYYLICHNCYGNGCRYCSHKGYITIAAGGGESRTWNSNCGMNISFCISVDRIVSFKLGLPDTRYLYRG